MKMPCTRQEEQQDQHEAQRILFRSTFNRNSAGLRYSNQQSLHSFALPHPHRQHLNQHEYQHRNHQQVAIVPQSSSSPSSSNHSNVNNQDDVTEQIRISVRDTHISHGSSDGEVGSNLAEDLNSMEESYLAYYNNLQRDYLENHSSTGLVIRDNLQNNQSINQALAYVPTASTSSSTSTSNPAPAPSSSNRIDTNRPQQQSSSNVQQSRRLIVLSKERNRETDGELSQHSNRPYLNQHPTDPKSSKKSMINQTKTQGHQKEKSTSKRPAKGQTPELQNESNYRVSDIDIIPLYKSNQAGVIKSYLFSGSSFSGQQNSSKESYEVNVKIQHVDHDSSYLNGYLCIAHLTKTHPKLTTFFEGEIISERYPFLTRKWEATEEVDQAHWSKFPGFSKDFFLDSFDYNELQNSEYVYMRWKELFLVPDHTIKNIDGASYAGFYYVCLHKRLSQMKGYYFHVADHFESFQSLDLELDREERTSQVYEFR